MGAERTAYVTRAARIVGAAVIVLAVGVMAGGNSYADPDHPPSNGAEYGPDAIVPTRINEYGQTYGSELGVMGDAELPDLIAVVSDAGDEGYLRKTDLLAEPKPKSPKEALAMQAAQQKNPPAFAVYASDGRTRIGTFTLTVSGGGGTITKDGEKIRNR